MLNEVDMTRRSLIKFDDLKDRRICENHTRLKDLITNQGFPPGFWTGPNTHVWWEEEVDVWLASCPTKRPSRRPNDPAENVASETKKPRKQQMNASS
jgi:hypothetical protein